jgi:hypothetical protein
MNEELQKELEDIVMTDDLLREQLDRKARLMELNARNKKDIDAVTVRSRSKSRSRSPASRYVGEPLRSSLKSLKPTDVINPPSQFELGNQDPLANSCNVSMAIPQQYSTAADLID